MTNEDWPNEILAVALFGSRARGDFDQNSDTDVFVLCNDVPFDRLLELKREVARKFTDLFAQKVDVAIYQDSLFNKMTQSNSLLLQHIKRESEIVYELNGLLTETLHCIGTFCSYSQELDIYDSILQQICDCGVPNEFDLHLLQMIVRNVSILICYFDRQPKFGRIEAYCYIKNTYKTFPLPANCFDVLTHWHLVYSKQAKASVSLPNASEYRMISSLVSKCILFCRSHVNAI